jgi:hypothetical protein
MCRLHKKNFFVKETSRFDYTELDKKTLNASFPRMLLLQINHSKKNKGQAWLIPLGERYIQKRRRAEHATLTGIFSTTNCRTNVQLYPKPKPLGVRY